MMTRSTPTFVAGVLRHLSLNPYSKPLISPSPRRYQTALSTPCMITQTPSSPSEPSTISKPSTTSNPSPNFPASFSSNASGEWFGHEITFSPRSGDALNIPDRYIPDEFRDWGVEIKGFDTVTSTSVKEISTSIYQKRTRALPTVGCEADAVIPEVAETEIVDAIGFGDGSYCAGVDGTEKWTFAVAHPGNTKSRVRLEFGRVDEKIGVVVVLFENWESTFNEGQILPGCGGEKSFADAPRLQTGDLAGKWAVVKEASSADGARVSQSETLTREDRPLNMCLPGGVSVNIQADNGLHVEVGWLVGAERVVLRRVYDADGLQCVTRAVETRQG